MSSNMLDIAANIYTRVIHSTIDEYFDVLGDGSESDNESESERMNLLNSSLPGWTRAFALRFTIHMMGDAHQPLHTVSRCTTKHPKGDAGGNLFKLNNSEYTHVVSQ